MFFITSISRLCRQFFRNVTRWRRGVKKKKKEKVGEKREIVKRRKTTSSEIHKAGNVNLEAPFLVRVIAVIAVS